MRDAVRHDAETLWAYHRLDTRPDHRPRPTDVGVGLGSHDPGVATHTAMLYRRGIFPLIVFTGANAPTTVARFPRGEAVHYRELAVAAGVPEEAILLEPRARNTGENLAFTRELLRGHGRAPASVTLVCRPYQQRRAFATAGRVWPEVEVVCSSPPLPLAGHLAAIGDADLVVSMLVGDTQRIWVYAERGFALPQPVPDDVRAAYERLVAAGYTSRLVRD